jgi:hypothetical protein
MEIKELIVELQKIADQAKKLASDIERHGKMVSVMHSAGHRMIDLRNLRVALLDFLTYSTRSFNASRPICARR